MKKVLIIVICLMVVVAVVGVAVRLAIPREKSNASKSLNEGGVIEHERRTVVSVKVGDTLSQLVFNTAYTPSITGFSSWVSIGNSVCVRELIGVNNGYDDFHPILGALKTMGNDESLYGIAVFPNGEMDTSTMIPIWVSGDFPLSYLGLSGTLPAGWQPTIKDNPVVTVNDVTVGHFAESYGYTGDPYNGVWVGKAFC